MIAGHQYYDLTGYTETNLLVRIDETNGTLVYWDGLRNEDLLQTSRPKIKLRLRTKRAIRK